MFVSLSASLDWTIVDTGGSLPGNLELRVIDHTSLFCSPTVRSPTLWSECCFDLMHRSWLAKGEAGAGWGAAQENAGSGAPDLFRLASLPLTPVKHLFPTVASGQLSPFYSGVWEASSQITILKANARSSSGLFLPLCLPWVPPLSEVLRLCLSTFTSWDLIMRGRCGPLRRGRGCWGSTFSGCWLYIDSVLTGLILRSITMAQTWICLPESHILKKRTTTTTTKKPSSFGAFMR